MEKHRPFLKWAGNKYRCLAHILAELPPGERLVEPFLGSGALFLNTHYPSYLLAEKNHDLISLYENIQQGSTEFINYCSHYFSEKTNQSAVYYENRVKFNQSEDERLRAALFLYLNRHGYNGLCRYNKKGQWNVPFGSYEKPYFPFQELMYFHLKSLYAKFIHADFRTTFEQTRPGDVVYCDPPYVPLSATASFTSYTASCFTKEDQESLAELALTHSRRGITVLISNHDTAFTRQIYAQARIVSFPVQRSISCKGSKRGTVQELLAIYKKS